MGTSPCPVPALEFFPPRENRGEEISFLKLQALIFIPQ